MTCFCQIFLAFVICLVNVVGDFYIRSRIAVQSILRCYNFFCWFSCNLKAACFVAFDLKSFNIFNEFYALNLKDVIFSVRVFCRYRFYILDIFYAYFACFKRRVGYRHVTVSYTFNVSCFIRYDCFVVYVV